MPVIPVAAAVYSVATAYSVGFAALSTFQVIATVSSVVGAIGAVTKNKTLQTIGLVGGVVGGIGSFAQAAGMLEGVGLAAESGAAFTDAFKSGAAFGGGAETAASVATVETAVETGAGAGAAAVPVTEAPPVTEGAWQAGDRIDAAPGPVTEPKAPPVTGAGAAPAAEADGLWSSFKGFAKDNPMIAFTGLTTAGNALAGLFDPTADSIVQKNEAEALALRNGVALAERQRANLAAPLPTFLVPNVANIAQPVSNTLGYTIDPVTGKAVAPGALASGLLNTVTGAPA